jgi:hypothetical protein
MSYVRTGDEATRAGRSEWRWLRLAQPIGEMAPGPPSG